VGAGRNKKEHTGGSLFCQDGFDGLSLHSTHTGLVVAVGSAAVLGVSVISWNLVCSSIPFIDTINFSGIIVVNTYGQSSLG